jgi:hypothetical protein
MDRAAANDAGARTGAHLYSACIFRSKGGLVPSHPAPAAGAV